MLAHRNNTTDEVAVVILPTIGSHAADARYTPKTFATELFNLWGIGQKDKDNGLLILMVMDERRVEFETGYGMEGILPDALCKRIQVEYMVPKFKQGDYDAGLSAGVNATLRAIENNTRYARQDSSGLDYRMLVVGASSVFLGDGLLALSESNQGLHDLGFYLTSFVLFNLCTFLIIWLSVLISVHLKRFLAHKNGLINGTAQKSNLTTHRADMVVLFWLPLVGLLVALYRDFSSWLYYFQLFIGYELLCLIIVAWVLPRLYQFGDIDEATQDVTHRRYLRLLQMDRQHLWTVYLFSPIIGFLYYRYYYHKQAARLRTLPRHCTQCQHTMVHLSEADEGEFQSDFERNEEHFEIADYDIWHCYSCDNNISLRYPLHEAELDNCSVCQKRGVYLSDSKITKKPTYTAAGKMQHRSMCLFCSYVSTQAETLPILIDYEATSSYSDDGSSSYSSSSSSYSSSSSSSSDNDFGGGSSGGGGAGSSW